MKHFLEQPSLGGLSDLTPTIADIDYELQRDAGHLFNKFR